MPFTGKLPINTIYPFISSTQSKNYAFRNLIINENTILTTVKPRFTSLHDFQKPNDERGLRLMDAAAKAVMEEFPDIVLAFGESDEYSYVLSFSLSLRLF